MGIGVGGSISDVVLGVVYAFFADKRVTAVLALIFLDWILAVAAAIKSGEFDWGRMAEFLKTMVLPYMLAFLGIYLVSQVIVDAEILGDYSNLVGEGAVLICWVALITNLGADCIRSAKALGLNFGIGGP